MRPTSDSTLVVPTRPTAVRWIVLAWLCVAGSIAYIHRICISVPSKQIQADLNLTDEQMGWVLGWFFLSYAAFQIPAAWLGSRWGNRKALPVFVVGWSVATAWMGMAGGYIAMSASRIINGVFQAGVLPCSAISVRHWFPVSQRAFPMGMLGSFQSVGAILATMITPLLLQVVDWRTAFVALSLLGGVWAAGFYWWFRELPETHPSVNAAELRFIRSGTDTSERTVASEQSSPAQAAPWLIMLTSATMWLICSQQFFRAAGYGFYGTWFPRFLQETRNVTMLQSGFLTTLPVLAVAVGSAAGGGLVDWIQQRTGSQRLSRQALAIVCLSLCSVCIFLAYFIADATQAVLLITLGSLFSGLGGPAGMTLTVDLSGRHIATSFATMNMAGNFGAAICPVIVARFVDVLPRWSITDKTEQWNLVLFFFVAIYAAAAVCWMFLNPNRPIFAEEPIS